MPHVAAALRRIRSWKKAKNPKKWLNLSCLNLTELPPLPSNLRRLKCYRNSLTSLEGLPKGLKRIWCNSNDLETFKGLPDGLLSLSCSNNRRLNSIEDIPNSVNYISLGDCDITIIKSLPIDLEYLDIWCMYSLSKIESFPLKLKELRISETTTDISFDFLPTLPQSLKLLELSVTRVKELSELPFGLETLFLIDNCITKIPPLPSSLRNLILKNYIFYKRSEDISIPIIPSTIKYFRCNNPKLNIG